MEWSRDRINMIRAPTLSYHVGWHASQLVCVNSLVGLGLTWELVQEPAVQEVDIYIQWRDLALSANQSELFPLEPGLEA